MTKSAEAIAVITKNFFIALLLITSNAKNQIHYRYFPMMADSLRVVASGHKSGAVKIAFFKADPHLHSRGLLASALTASRIITWAFLTFLFRYSITAFAVTAS